MDDPPLGFSGHGIDVPFAQEANIARGFQVVQRLRIRAIFAVEKLNGALVLQPPIDQQLLAPPLRFESHARHLHVQRDAYDGPEQEYQEQREARLRFPLHPAISASSGNVC
jgi:hypothetical protein